MEVNDWLALHSHVAWGHPPWRTEFDEERWANDILNKCHFDDRLWGYTIRVVEELRTRDPAVFTDGVLFNLMRMGVNDWVGENSRGNQSTQAMQLATALASRMIRITNADRTNVSDVAGGLESQC